MTQTTDQDTATSAQPRLVEEIRRQMAEAEALCQEFEQAGELDFASAATLQSIRNLRLRMQEELRAAEMLESGADAEFSLDGDPVQGHQVAAGFLGDFLRSVQDLVHAVAQVVVGQPTRRAPVPGSIVASSRLSVLPDFVPGSFGFRVRLPREDELELLPGALDENRRAMALVGDIVGDRISEESLAELLSHSRVKSHYGRLVALLSAQNADVCVRTRANPHGSRVSAKRARERREWLDLLQTTTRTVTLEGRLVGGSIERRRFELVAQDGSYAGTVSEQAAGQMQRLHWGDSVQALLRVTTVEHEEMAGEPTEQYHAESFVRPAAASELTGKHGKRMIRLETEDK